MPSLVRQVTKKCTIKDRTAWVTDIQCAVASSQLWGVYRSAVEMLFLCCGQLMLSYATSYNSFTHTHQHVHSMGDDCKKTTGIHCQHLNWQTPSYIINCVLPSILIKSVMRDLKIVAFSTMCNILSLTTTMAMNFAYFISIGADESHTSYLITHHN